MRSLFAVSLLMFGSFSLRAEESMLETALTQAKANRKELEKALEGVSAEERIGMRFLIENMPESDLKNLTADYLISNVKLAYRARTETPWGKTIPEERFLNDVLPYANVDEKRENWRKDFFEMCLPLVKDCKTASEAAQKLNVELFDKLKVKYSTQRKAPNQAPQESIEQGKASCTGLSIILSDACRSVGIPARLVGTPLWANKRGNHTWVEIWDGEWFFTGACEADKNGLNRGWFVGDAAQAQKDSLEHAIYASSFKKSKTYFPLVWARNNQTVPAENVTDRYAKKSTNDKAILLIRVLNAEKKRIETQVTIQAVEDANLKFEGKSRSEGADLNDLLKFELPAGKEFVVRVGTQEKTVKSPEAGKELLVDIVAK
jgi:hypothetical protein